jgi:dihydroorotate dehydrogenase electron transfer subunit
MLWIPGVDEIPLSILDTDRGGAVSVAVREVGKATSALHRMKAGDVAGIRGPFGNSFTPSGKRILMVAGGTGTAPLLFLARKLASEAMRIVFVQGANTREELLFMNEVEGTLRKGRMELVTTTEDGSYGIKGLCTEPTEEILKKERFDIICSCGPEQMIVKTFDLAEKHGVPMEASLERLMRCAIGLCGSCIIGRYRVCKDGPVFTSRQLREMRKEFGISKRDFDGGIIPLS